MNLVEKDIADAIEWAVIALGIPGAQVISPWAIAQPGETRNREDPSSCLIVEIAVGNRMFDTPQQCMAQWDCGIEVSVRDEFDPTGSIALDAWTKIADMLQDWQDDLDAVQTSLQADSFDLTGFRLDGGQSPVRDRNARCLRIRQNFTVRGTINRQTTTQGE